MIRASAIFTACAAGLLGAVLADGRMLLNGRWVLLEDGQPAPSDDFIRGLQTSGLAWDGRQLWSVGDQRAAFAGCLYAINPETARLNRPPIPLTTDDPAIQELLDQWGRLDAEGIDVLNREERQFIVLLEADAPAALLVRVAENHERANIEALWHFEFPGEAPEPYRHDPNYRLEGIAVDPATHTGFVAFERDRVSRPHLYRFDLGRAPSRGIGHVPLQVLPFDAWNELRGKRGAALNANGLEVIRSLDGQPRLLVLCRDRELLFTIEPQTARLVGQVELQLCAPDAALLEWSSPEGVALDPVRGMLYIVSDPDSTDGNWRLRSTEAADGSFAQFVPLLFEMKLPDSLSR